MAQEALRVNILGAEEEKMASLNDMSHVVIGAEATVSDKDGTSVRRKRVTIDDGSEGAKFILLSNGLNDGVGITIGVQVKESG